jgi:hypothetical protein
MTQTLCAHMNKRNLKKKDWGTQTVSPCPKVSLSASATKDSTDCQGTQAGWPVSGKCIKLL